MTPEQAYERVKYAYTRYAAPHGYLGKERRGFPEFHELTKEEVKLASKFARDSKHPGKIDYMKTVRKGFREYPRKKNEATMIFTAEQREVLETQSGRDKKPPPVEEIVVAEDYHRRMRGLVDCQAQSLARDPFYEMHRLAGMRPTLPSLTEARSGITERERKAALDERGAGAPVKLKDQHADAKKRAKEHPGSKWGKHAAKLKRKMQGKDEEVEEEDEQAEAKKPKRSFLKRFSKEVAEEGDRPFGEAKRPTFKAARAAILAHLQQKGWKVKAGLKVPHATTPDGELRLWFKSQAVWYSWGDKHSLGNARSLHIDLRDKSPEEFEKEAEKWGRKWGKDMAHYFD